MATFEKPLELPAGTELKIAMRMGNMPGCVRFSLTKAAEPKAPPVLLNAELCEPNSTVAQRRLHTAWIASREELKDIATAISAAWAKIPSGYTSVLHLPSALADTSVRPIIWIVAIGISPSKLSTLMCRPVFMLGTTVTRGTVWGWQCGSSIDDLRSQARVAVNRVWQAMFGDGLVETAEDIGTRVMVPEHRELLDWLAV